MDEATGGALAADQWAALHDEARLDHPEHEDTDPDLCPICYDGGEAE